ncbi:hypothetical protein AURDEDRAFT_171803 [Auricularia subglabra TFB-10046 SS5]|nr:hypothetical protein AURDEDRAFT_171803 [Auricularia subglabra TFB-10046 SS5]
MTNKTPATFPYSDEELKKIGTPELARTALALMRERPDLLPPNKWALECVVALGREKARASAAPSDSSMTAAFPAPSAASNSTFAYVPSDYERACYYSGISGEGECPVLIYRSDYLSNPLCKPTGRYDKPVVKSIYGAEDTPLGKIWATVLDDIRLIVKTAVPNYSCIDACRFYSHGPDGFTQNPDGETDGGSLGPAVVWVGVPPASTSVDTAHDASQKILALLHKSGVDDASVEWRGAVVTRL